MCSARQIRRAMSRLLSTTMLLFLVVATASAYTIVMRDGRRLEIPSRFIVTPSTVTYEVQPGIQITLQMSTIDVAATEKANNEPTGALLRRAQLQSAASESSKVRTPSGRKTITNRDLEAAARRRLASEQAYEKRARELGLSPLDESRKQAEAAAAVVQNELRERLAAERESEEYWRGRATALRTEMAALDAEIRYIRARLDEFPYPNWGGSFTTFTSIVPFISFGNVGRGRHFPGIRGQRPGVFVAPRGIGPQLSGRAGFGGGATRGRVFINPGQVGRGPVGHRSHVGVFPGSNLPLGGGLGILPNVPVFGSSPVYDYSYERSELITRFNDLAAARAGLNARWRELEEEARRAGVSPGWLRR
jgi:hypothetical protein